MTLLETMNRTIDLSLLRDVPTTVARRAKGLSLLDMVALYRQRRALAHLDAAALADIGVSEDAARREASRPSWDVPRHWRG